MASECSCRSELAELVAYHVLRNVNRNKLVSIMNCDSVTHKVRRDHTCA